MKSWYHLDKTRTYLWSSRLRWVRIAVNRSLCEGSRQGEPLAPQLQPQLVVPGRPYYSSGKKTFHLIMVDACLSIQIGFSLFPKRGVAQLGLVGQVVLEALLERSLLCMQMHLSGVINRTGTLPTPFRSVKADFQ